MKRYYFMHYRIRPQGFWASSKACNGYLMKAFPAEILPIDVLESMIKQVYTEAFPSREPRKDEVIVTSFSTFPPVE